MPNQWSNKLSNHHALWQTKHDDDWLDVGVVQLPHGTVVVERIDGYTRLRINHAGHIHTEQHQTRYSRRYCVTLAKRFAQHMLGELTSGVMFDESHWPGGTVKPQTETDHD